VTTTSALGRPSFGMPLLDHKSRVSPSDFVSRGLEPVMYFPLYWAQEFGTGGDGQTSSSPAIDRLSQ
jgi:hypothetical protein